MYGMYGYYISNSARLSNSRLLNRINSDMKMRHENQVHYQPTVQPRVRRPRRRKNTPSSAAESTSIVQQSLSPTSVKENVEPSVSKSASVSTTQKSTPRSSYKVSACIYSTTGLFCVYFILPTSSFYLALI